jgi:Flp pilus assembly protein CpaB
MKSKNMTLMIVAIGCGLVAAFLTARLSGGSGPEMIDVIVAKKELPVGTLLDEKEFDNYVTQAKFLKTNVPQDVITNPEDLKGKKLNRTLKPGNFFAAGDVGADNGIRLPDGMYKYSIKIDMVKAASGFIQPGDHVDVILTEPLPNGKAKSGMMLRDMLVLSVDTRARRTEAGESVQQVNSVSLAVTSEQALFLSSAEKRGEVKLVLRDSKNADKHQIAAKTKIPGFDEDESPMQPATPPVKTVAIIVAKADVPLNTLITKDNYDTYFTVREFTEETVPTKALKDAASVQGMFVVNKLEADQILFNTWLSKEMIEVPVKTVVVEKGMNDPQKGDPEFLPVQPRELAQEKPAYPRKFLQTINNQRVWFIETAPGEFRRAEDSAADLKDLPDSTPKSKKPENAQGDRAI